MHRRNRPHTVDVLFVITLFCVFAISIMMLTGTGASVYEKIVSDMETNYQERTAVTYLVNKVHQSDEAGLVSIGTYSGLDALVMLENINDETYGTYLYYYDGSLREIFTRLGQEFDPSLGTKILEVESLDLVSITDSLYRFNIKPVNGTQKSVLVHTYSK